MKLTDDQIRELLELEGDASPAPWKSYVSDSYGMNWEIEAPICEDLRSKKGVQLPVAVDMRSGDADLCAATRNALRPLLEEILEHRKYAEAFRERFGPAGAEMIKKYVELKIEYANLKYRMESLEK